MSVSVTNSFQFTVRDKCDAPDIIIKWATKTISLLDPGWDMPGFLPNPNHLILHFHDVDVDGWQHVTAPTMADYDAILAFSQSFTPQDRVFVHCHAGISRSTASMIAILIQHGIPWRTAFDLVRQDRPILWPNSLLVRFTDEKFNLGGEYRKFIREWKAADLRERIAIKPPDKAAIDQMKQWSNLLK